MLSTDFSYDNRDCSEFGLYVVRLQRGMVQTPYTSNKTILEEHPKKVITPFFFGVQHQPLTFDVTLAPIDADEFDQDKLYEIGRWLFQDKYKPFISGDNEGKIYYCMPVNKVDFYTNDFKNGYINLEFRCRDGFGWTFPQEAEYDLSDNVGSTPTSIVINNVSNVGVEYYYPEIEIELQESETGFSITNNSDGGRVCSFSGLDTSETIYIDNQKKTIVSDTDAYRFDEWNKIWFRLVQGYNYIDIVGKCIITFKTQYPII